MYNYYTVRVKNTSHFRSKIFLHTLQVEGATSDISRLSLQDSNVEKVEVAECAEMKQKQNSENANEESAMDVALLGKEVVREIIVPMGKEVCSPSPEPTPMEPESCREHTVVPQPAPPPYSAVGPHQNTLLPGDQCVTEVSSEVPIPSPPPYTLLPAFPQQPCVEASPRDPNYAVNVHAGNGLLNFQCAVCKHKSKYPQSPGQRISAVRCPKCKECTVGCICIICIYVYTFLLLSMSSCSQLCLRQRVRCLAVVVSAIIS